MDTPGFPEVLNYMKCKIRGRTREGGRTPYYDARVYGYSRVLNVVGAACPVLPLQFCRWGKADEWKFHAIGGY